jgi:predicted Rossmann fold nucleotide-binding protein DprA/Smf involved in DNA uptake
MTAVAIVGSRDYPDLQQVRDYVRSLREDVTIISGGARGVDQMAARTAEECGLELIEIDVSPAEFAKYGKGAYHRRNTLIAKLCDSLVAFSWNESRGTNDVIDQAIRNGKHVTVYIYKEGVDQ